jgi:hypothetical protein
MPAGAVMVHVFAASRNFEYRDMAAAGIDGSAVLVGRCRLTAC